MLWSPQQVLFELRPELSGGARHVTISEKIHAKAPGQASAWPHMFNELQGIQGSGMGSPGYQVLLDLVRPDKGVRFHAQPARGAGEGNEEVSLGAWAVAVHGRLLWPYMIWPLTVLWRRSQ